jgi:catechol 2,3-dioxygenase-like lactoylglutathione lyase family enzyme
MSVTEIDAAHGGSPSQRAALQATRDMRRDANRIRRLHHHALRTDNMEATRHFYEDVLGMPMVAAWRESMDTTGDLKTPFLHCFFELGDGSALAFFQFLPDARGPAPKLPRDGVDHHIAFAVPTFADIERLKEKLETLGYRCCGINHGFAYSLYVRDPNGMLVEFVSDAAIELEVIEASAASAHEELAKWNRKDHAPNKHARGTTDFPLPTSPAEDIKQVMFAG